MSTKEVIEELQKKSGLTLYAIGRRLGLKCQSHVYMFMREDKNKREPNISTCKKIIKLAKEYGMNITLDTLRG